MKLILNALLVISFLGSSAFFYAADYDNSKKNITNNFTNIQTNCIHGLVEGISAINTEACIESASTEQINSLYNLIPSTTNLNYLRTGTMIVSYMLLKYILENLK